MGLEPGRIISTAISGSCEAAGIRHGARLEYIRLFRAAYINLSVYFLAFFLFPFPVYARSDAEADRESQVTSIEITGLKRTRESTLRRIIKVTGGAPCTGETEEEIRQNILRAGIFRTNTLETRREQTTEGCKIIIFVEDKWTLIPVPIFYASEGSFAGGLSLAELNFLGQGFMISGSFIISNKTVQAGLGTHFHDTNIITNYSRRKRSDISTYGNKDETLRKAELEGFKVRIIQNFPLKYSWMLRGNFGFRYTHVFSGEWEAAPAITGQSSFVAGIGILYKGQKIEGLYRLGLAAALNVDYITPKYFTLDGWAEYAFLLWGEQAFPEYGRCNRYSALFFRSFYWCQKW